MEITKNEKETKEFAKKIAEKVRKGGVVCLFGDLGTGKTTFTKGFAQALGIDTFSIKSPTYTYIRDYKLGKNNLYHIDLYRLETIDELLLQEMEEFLINKNNIMIIEWADRLKDHLPKDRIDICLEYLDENSRKITVFDPNEQS
jgi:tRNA threonylcarbamoyladenosine biosynthesis protein TsaE